MSANTTIPTTASTASPAPATSSASSRDPTTSLSQPSTSAATSSAATSTPPATTSPSVVTTSAPTSATPTSAAPTSAAPPATTSPTTTATTSQLSSTSTDPIIVTTTVLPTDKTVTHTITSTNVTPGLDIPTTSASSTSTTTDIPIDNSATAQSINTSVGGSNGGNGGLNGTTKVVVAVIVPIIGVAFVAILLLFLWKRRQKTRADAEARRKEVEEYGYNPNNDPHGGAATAVAAVGVARSSSNGEETLYEMTENDGAGYRGWGSTNGGRKASNIGSSAGTSVPMSPVGIAFSDGGFPQQQGNIVGSGPDGYTGVATSPSTSTFPVGNSPSVDGSSNAPLIHGNRPATADSSVIGAMNGPTAAENSGGIHRGISNASSNYSAMTQSDQSDVGQPLSHHDAQYYGVDDGYEDAYYSSRNPAHPYSGDNGYGPAPVIRDVSARRNTRIETPTSTHFPQQGNSGIAQNF